MRLLQDGSDRLLQDGSDRLLQDDRPDAKGWSTTSVKPAASSASSVTATGSARGGVS